MPRKPRLPSMKKRHPEQPGMERDNKGKPIPVEKRLTEDRAKVHRASARARPKKKKKKKKS